MKVEIKKEYVFDEVEKISAYIGAKKGRYNEVVITVEEHEALAPFWSAGCGAVIEMLKKFATGCSSLNTHHAMGDIEIFEITLNAPHITENTAQLITSNITLFLINYISSQWLNITSPEDAKKYSDICIAKEREIVRLAYYRPMPIK